MAHTNFLFTSEFVSEGHPDKVCDQISDAVLDAFLENDIKLGIADDSQVNTRLGCETLSTTNKIVIAGEGRAQSPFFHKHGDKVVVNREMIAQIARDVVKDIGYDQDGFLLLRRRHRGAAARPVARHRHGRQRQEEKGGEEEGAGDQGMMFGFACTESEVYEKNSFMPAPIYFAHKILKVLSDKRRAGQLFDLQPDAKSQVAVNISTTASRSAAPKWSSPRSTMRKAATARSTRPAWSRLLIGSAVESALPKGWMPRGRRLPGRPTGDFVVGGPDGDCGLTGRKIIVYTYRGYAPHGGGCCWCSRPKRCLRNGGCEDYANTAPGACACSSSHSASTWCRAPSAGSNSTTRLSRGLALRHQSRGDSIPLPAKAGAPTTCP